MEWQSLIGPAIVAALVSGGFTYWRDRSSRRQARRQRARDLVIALKAEIDHYVSVLRQDDLQAYLEYTLSRIQDDPDYVPFVPKEANRTIFLALQKDVLLLPEKTISPVIAYYSQLAAIEALIEDARGERFVHGDDDAFRANLMRDFFSLKVSALDYGETAIEALSSTS